MKHYLRFIALVIICIGLMAFTVLSTEKYDVQIVQQGVPIDIVGGIALLKREPFQLKITLKNIEGVFMSASFQRDYYNLKETDSIPDYKWLNAKTRVESTFNTDKELAVDKESVSFLFYDSLSDWHRFDKEVEVKGTTVFGTKTIEAIYNEEDKIPIKLKDIKQDVYLFFVATEEWKTGQASPKELGRLKLLIKWQ